MNVSATVFTGTSLDAKPQAAAVGTSSALTCSLFDSLQIYKKYQAMIHSKVVQYTDCYVLNCMHALLSPTRRLCVRQRWFVGLSVTLLKKDRKMDCNKILYIW